MLKKQIFTAFLLLIQIHAISQTLLPVRKNGKWGYINEKGEIVLEPKYDYAQNFECKLAKVYLGNKIGLINEVGQYVLEPKEDQISLICPNYILIKEDSLFGLDNLKGEKLLNVEYKQIEYLGNNLFVLDKAKQKTLFNARTKVLSKDSFDKISRYKNLFLVTKESMFGLIDTNAFTIVSIENKIIEPIQKGFAIKNKDFWAIADTNGKILTKDEYLNYSEVTPNLIQLKTKQGLHSLLNIDLNTVVAVNLSESYQMLSPELIITTKSNRHGLIDLNGDVILPTIYTNIHLNENLLLTELNGKWGLYDLEGKVIIPPIHNKIFPFKNDIAVFESEGYRGIIDNKGYVLLKPKYRYISIDDKRVLLTDNTGVTSNYTIESLKQRANNRKKLNSMGLEKQFDNQHIWVKNTANKWGLVGHDTLLIAPQFDIVLQSDKDYSLVGSKADYRMIPKIFGQLNSQKLVNKVNFKIGLVNKSTGEILIPPSVWYINLKQFVKYKASRVVLEEGKEALILANKKFIKNYTTFNRERKTVSIPFSYIGNFTDTIAPFCINAIVNYNGDFENPIVSGGQWGYISTSGKVVIEPIFENAAPMIEGHAIVKYKGLYGLINKDGQFRIKPEYYSMEYLSINNIKLFKVSQKKQQYGLINAAGKIVADALYEKIHTPKEGYFRYMKNGLYGFMDTTGIMLTNPTYENAQDFSHGVAAICQSKLWGFIDTTGNIVVPPSMSMVGSFVEGYAVIYKDGKYGYGTPDGRISLLPAYFAATNFSNGFAIVRDMYDKYGVIDTKGEYAIKSGYLEIQQSNIPYIYKLRDEQGWRLFDLSAKKFISKKYFKSISNNISEGLVVVFLDGFYQYMDLKGKLLSGKYSYAEDFSNGFATVADKTGYKVINTDGKVQPQFKSRLATVFQNNRAFIEIGKKQYALINTKGERLNNEVYTAVFPFREGYARVTTPDNMSFHIDTTGKRVYKAKFESVSDFKNGVAKAKLNGEWGLINNKGHLISNFEFDYIGEFEDGVAVFGFDKKYGIIDFNNEKVAEIIYNDVELIDNKIIKLTLSNKLGYMDMKGHSIYDITQ